MLFASQCKIVVNFVGQLVFSLSGGSGSGVSGGAAGTSSMTAATTGGAAMSGATAMSSATTTTKTDCVSCQEVSCAYDYATCFTMSWWLLT